MQPNDLAQAPPDAISNHRSSHSPRGDKARTKRFRVISRHHAEHHQLPANGAAF
jgi:hypothetical protein